MAAPATPESKPGSAARDAGGGQARNARRVTGPLAGAVLGPAVCGGRERGRWHRTTPTIGLFQRDGGWFRPGGEVFVTEEGLIEGVDVGGEPSIQAADAGVKRRDIGAYVLADGVVSGVYVLADGFETAVDRKPEGQANPRGSRSTAAQAGPAIQALVAGSGANHQLAAVRTGRRVQLRLKGPDRGLGSTGLGMVGQ